MGDRTVNNEPVFGLVDLKLRALHNEVTTRERSQKHNGGWAHVVTVTVWDRHGVLVDLKGTPNKVKVFPELLLKAAVNLTDEGRVAFSEVTKSSSIWVIGGPETRP